MVKIGFSYRKEDWPEGLWSNRCIGWNLRPESMEELWYLIGRGVNPFDIVDTSADDIMNDDIVWLARTVRASVWAAEENGTGYVDGVNGRLEFGTLPRYEIRLNSMEEM